MTVAAALTHSETPTPALYLLCRDGVQDRHIAKMLRGLPWTVRSFTDASVLLNNLQAGCIVAVDEQGLDLLILLERVRARKDRVRTILLTSRPSVTQATAALRAGINDLLEMPVQERRLRHCVREQMASINLKKK